MGDGPMATTHRSDLVEQLEKALTDEAYDGGNGALSDEQFTNLVRKLATTAAAVVAETCTPTRITIEHEGGNTVTGTLEQVLNHGHLKPGWKYRDADLQAEPSDAHDRDRDGICRTCGRGLTAAEILDGELPCVTEGEPSDTDLIAWHVDQVGVLRPFIRSSAHLKAAMMHAATVRALRAAGGVR